MPIVIGLLGKPRAGKGTSLSLLKDIIAREFGERVSIKSSRFSDVMREMCVEKGIPQTREVLQKMGQDIEREGIERGEGPGGLSRMVRKRIEGMLDVDIVVVDGVRWLTDEQLVRSFEKNFLIFVFADQKTRHVRGQRAAENTGDATKTFEEFCAEDNAPNERFIEEIGERSNVMLCNDEEDERCGRLREQLLCFFEKEIRPLLADKH